MAKPKPKFVKPTSIEIPFTDADILDATPIRYSDGSTLISGAELDRKLEQAARGEITLPKLPPPSHDDDDDD